MERLDLDEARVILKSGRKLGSVSLYMDDAETLRSEGFSQIWESGEAAPVAPVKSAAPYTPLTVTQLCRLGGYAKAAAPLVAAGADADTVQEILLSDRRDEFMSSIANDTADAKYVLQLASVANNPLSKVVDRMIAEQAKGKE